MKELALALAKAQSAFKHIARDKTVTVRTRTGSAYTFAYAPLETIMVAIKDALTTNEIALLQDVREGKVVTILAHSSGDIYTSTGTVIKVAEGSSAQEYGSGLTYARRYDLSLTLGLCPDDDDDGNAADGNQATTLSKEAAKHAKNVRAPITPTTGAWEHIPETRQEVLRRLGSEIIDHFSNNDPRAAWECVHGQKLENDEKVAVWSMLDSKQRSALKKISDEQNNRLLAEQA